MWNEITPVLTLLIGATSILVGGRLARRLGLSETIGNGLALCVVAVVIGLSPDAWRTQWAGGAEADRLLTYTRFVGLTGLLFLAGTSFHKKRARGQQIVFLALLAALLFTTATLLLRFLLNQPIGAAALISATVVASSLWFPVHRHPDYVSAKTHEGSPYFPLLLTAIAMLGIYFTDILTAIPGIRRSLFHYAIVTLYELVKLAVIFSFAFFISTRFLARAGGRISELRTNVGFILISILLYSLMFFAVGVLGAVSWAFVAGVLWRQTKAGEEFSKRTRPLASSLLLSFTFLSLLLQSHGRQFDSFFTLAMIALGGGIALKLLSVWVVSKGTSMQQETSGLLLAHTAFSGEIAILFLSFSINRWFIDGSLFFAVLVYALASSLLIPLLMYVLERRNVIRDEAAKLIGVRMKSVF